MTIFTRTIAFQLTDDQIRTLSIPPDELDDDHFFQERVLDLPEYDEGPFINAALEEFNSRFVRPRQEQDMRIEDFVVFPRVVQP
ncbi:hypothetical protein HCH_03345 [Hahella chejuensis KCTC 2396]|uniref:Uncharacterized protein n=1 Tax=Hahella chejuensis (strain KCTC 2396) TaxID=349521 RepID=Q2SGX5_HAHCH|nr:hypothetical protein [Hahella chejuensis]ABC30099.1 hypothetical protein HCH_03345 [Hahella chejuensis KCTC 2396]